jgi:malate permease and related proteins
MTWSYVSLLATVAPVFITLACGFGLRRLGKLQPAADPSLLTLAVNFLYPCLIAHTVLRSKALEDKSVLFGAPIAGALLLAGSFAVAALVARALRIQKPQPAATFIFTAAIPNWGYVPIPLVKDLFGEGTTGVLFVHNIGLELTLWSLGIWVLSGERSWRRALNIPFFAILGALALNLVNAAAWLPGFVLDSLGFLGQAAIPLSLILAGATLADALAEGGLLQHKGHTIAGCVVRLLLLPPLVILAARWLPSKELKQVLVVQAAMPCALVPVLLSRHYRADGATAVRIVIATTILGLLTIPLWLQLGAKFAGLE